MLVLVNNNNPFLRQVLNFVFCAKYNIAFRSNVDLIINFPIKEMEAERVKLLEEVTSNKRKMQELESNLLYKLTSIQGSLVEDESLIEVLKVTKIIAQEVLSSLIVMCFYADS